MGSQSVPGAEPATAETIPWASGKVLGPLAPKSSKIHFTAFPDGVIKHLMIFDRRGRLLPAVDVGATGIRPKNKGCWPVAPAGTIIPLCKRLFRYGWIMKISYVGPAPAMQIRFGAGVRDVAVTAGHGDAYVPVIGEGSSVLVRRRLLSSGQSACISSLAAGLLYASRPPAIRASAAGRNQLGRSDRGHQTEPRP